MDGGGWGGAGRCVGGMAVVKGVKGVGWACGQCLWAVPGTMRGEEWDVHRVGCRCRVRVGVRVVRACVCVCMLPDGHTAQPPRLYANRSTYTLKPVDTLAHSLIICRPNLTVHIHHTPPSFISLPHLSPSSLSLMFLPRVSPPCLSLLSLLPLPPPLPLLRAATAVPPLPRRHCRAPTQNWAVRYVT